MQQQISFKVVIPARFASSRLPGKPLLDIAGKPMVIHVAERAKASGAEEICIATDHVGIYETAFAYGIDAVMTRDDHVSGTDRIAEVAAFKKWDAHTLVVNVQGDEPLIEPLLIRRVAANLATHTDASIATVCHSLHEYADMFNPNIVKVTMDHDGYALYFSRAPIPYARDAFAAGQQIPRGLPVYRHVGLYAYRAGFLSHYARLQAAPIEQFESLEQLRALWHGYKISVEITATAPSPGVDTQDDLDIVRQLFKASTMPL